MAKEGLLERVDVEPAAAGPERTAYRLTTDGETEFQMLLGKGLAGAEPDPATQHNFSAAFTFLTALPRKRAISLLRHRLTQWRGQRANAANILEDGADWGQPAHITELYRLWLAIVEANVRWTEDLIGRLEEGAYVMADDSPDHCAVVIKLD
jgi:DNA-binding PadR family transcriptional regulator